MPAEHPVADQKEAAEIRRRVGELAREALDKLAEELAQFSRRHGVSETWTKKFKIVADQIRRDFRLEGEAAPVPPPAETEEADPLAKLRVVSEDEEVA